MKYNIKIYIISIYDKCKTNILNVYNSDGSSHEIAMGAAIGAFWGVFPTFGLSTILTIVLYKFFRFNFLAAISAAFISNPLTSPFLLFISYKVGTIFISTDIVLDYDNWYKNLKDVGFIMLIGSIIVSLLTSIVIYYLTKYVIERRRRRNAFS